MSSRSRRAFFARLRNRCIGVNRIPGLHPGKVLDSAESLLASQMLSFDVMSKPQELRCYAYVNRPYAVVRQALHQRPRELLQRATTSAAERANSLATSLRAGAAGIEIGVEVRIHVHGVREEEGVAGLSPITRLSLGWEAARAPAVFPVMSAELSAWPLSASETQLEIEGTYQPPLGAVGKAVDAAVGHRIAQASVHKLLEDIVEQLRREPVPAT